MQLLLVEADKMLVYVPKSLTSDHTQVHIICYLIREYPPSERHAVEIFYNNLAHYSKGTRVA